MEYMSQECYDQLVAEIQELVNVELPKAKDELVEALVGKRKGDVVEAHVPVGIIKLRIDNITI